MEVTIYRIIQELLTNTIKDSQANSIIVQCSENNNTIYITVEDDGIGFNPNQYNPTGLGLKNKKKRVQYLQGQIEIISVENNGTVINIEFNLNGKEKN